MLGRTDHESLPRGTPKSVSDRTLVWKLTVLLLLPIAGSAIALVGFVLYLNMHAGTDHFINFVGGERMLAERIGRVVDQSFAQPTGDHGDALDDLIALYDRRLTALQHGGVLNGQTLPPPTPDIHVILTQWDEQWQRLEPLLLKVVDPELRQATDGRDHQAINTALEALIEHADRAIEQRGLALARMRKALLGVLAGCSLLTLMTLAFGVVVVRGYVTERRHADRALRMRVAQQQAMTELGQCALAGDTVDQLMASALSSIRELMGLDFAQILELLPGGREFRVRASLGGDGVDRDSKMPMDSYAGYALKVDAPVIIECLDTDVRFPGSSVLKDQGVASGILVTIRTGTQPYGVVGVFSRTPAHFLRDDARFITAVGTVLAGAVCQRAAEQMLLKQTEDLTLARDEITEHAEMLTANSRQLEEARVAAESATKAKSDFLANMSHEIRTPMTAILGYTDLLLSPQQAAEDRSRAIQAIHRNGEHLLSIINDILDISKIESGLLSVSPVVCSPNQIVCEVVSMMRPRAADKSLSLDLEFLGPIPATIRSDPNRVRQILTNLVGNAIKFTESGGVRIVMKLIDGPGGTRLAFEVIDTGIGMSPDSVDEVFTAFSQADTTMSRQFGGMGLGLTITKRLVDMLSGQITVQSEPGEGSAFHFMIETGALDGVAMIQQPTEAFFADTGAQTLDGTQTSCEARVLLAEDGPDNQRLISFHLRKAGAQVSVCENGQIAYERAAEAWRAGEPFDVILMDMQMPEMDGYSATSLLRSDGYTGPIVALTAHAMKGDRERCIAAGCDDYATKPIDRQQLIALVAEHAGKSKSVIAAAE